MYLNLSTSLAFLAVPIAAAVVARLSVAGVARWIHRHGSLDDEPVLAESFSWSARGVHAFQSLKNPADEQHLYDVDSL